MDNGNPIIYDGDFQNRLLKRIRLREIRKSVLYVLTLILISYLSSYGVYFAGIFLQMLIPSLSTPIAIQFLDMTAYIAQLFIPILIYMLIFRKKPGQIYNLRSHNGDEECTCEEITPFSILSYFALAFSLSQVMSILSNIFSAVISSAASMFFEGFMLDPQAFYTPIPGTPFEFALSIISVALLPALLEEFLFRGIFLCEFLKYGKTFAIVISAFFFASVHGSIEQMMYSFVYGIIFGYIAIKTGSLTTGIIIHFINNAYSCIVDYLSGIYDTNIFRDIITVINFSLIFIGLVIAVCKLLLNNIGYHERTDSEKQPCELTGRETFSVFRSPIMLLYYAWIIFETLYIYISYNLTSL